MDDYLHDWHREARHGGARNEQREPQGDWFWALWQAGRGFGKTRTVLELARRRLDQGIWHVVNAAAPTWTDVEDTLVWGSDAAPGFMRLWPSRLRPVPKLSGKNPHLRTWNGGVIRLRSAKEAERFRGPQADGGVVDELDSWKPDRMKPSEALALFEMGIRLGTDPRIFGATTPKRNGLVRDLRKRDDVVVTRGRTMDNAENLADRFLTYITSKYGGTHLGRQELEGELLDEVMGALVTHELIEENRVEAPSSLRRVVVGVDPSGTSGPVGSSQGIVPVGIGVDDETYTLADKSCSLEPSGWGRRVMETYLAYEADAIVVERNFGGDMVSYVLETTCKHMGLRIPHIIEVSASRGKVQRYEPVAALHQQGRHHHVGMMETLEDQTTCFTANGFEGEDSPDRADAEAWAVFELALRHETEVQVFM